MKNRMRDLTAAQLFVWISGVGIILFLLYSVAFGHISFQWLCMTNEPSYMFLDYFKHVLYTAEPLKLYENAKGLWGCFPPFIYMLYFLLYRMTSFMGITPENWREYMAIDESLTVFLYYSVFVVIGLLLVIQLWHNKRGVIPLFLCLLMSAPYFAGLERGNSIMLVLVLLLAALKWRDDASRGKREAALILIAICAAIKIYPAIFGFLYIKERRYREGFRLLGYGVLFFFGPFLFFGGLHGFQLWLSNVSSTLVTYSIGRVEYIRGLVTSIAYFVSGGKWTADYFSLVAPNLYLVIMLVLFFLSRDRYRTVFFLCAIMVFYPSNAFRYTLCYLSIPLIMYLSEHGDERFDRRILFAEIAGYGLLFTIPTLFGLFTNFNEQLFRRNTHLTYVELRLYVIAYILLGLVVAHEMVEVVKYKRYDTSLTQKLRRKRKME